MKIKLVKCCMIMIITPLLCGCFNNEYNLLSGKYYGFSTLFDVRLYNGEESMLKQIENYIDLYDEYCDPYHGNSAKHFTYMLNNTNEVIKVSDEYFALIESALNYQELTQGYFNLLTFELNELWKNALQNATIPSENDINSVIKDIDESFLILDRQALTIQRLGKAKIDFGAIGKGYCINQIVSQLKNNSFEYYLINGGDSSIALGKKPYVDDYTVGIQDVSNAYFLASDCFITTSSIYKQGVEIDGKIYSHIVNPFNGSAISNYDSVIILSDLDAGLLDAFSTAFSLMDLSKIQTYELEYDLKLVLIKQHEIVYISDGLEVMYH